jgi:hypothetical protein
MHLQAALGLPLAPGVQVLRPMITTKDSGSIRVGSGVFVLQKVFTEVARSVDQTFSEHFFVSRIASAPE